MTTNYLWAVADLRNVLKAAAVAGIETAQMSGNGEYLRGYFAALRIVCIAIGIRADELQVIPAEGRDT